MNVLKYHKTPLERQVREVLEIVRAEADFSFKQQVR